MKVCAVSSCRNDSFRRPELSFFNLPRDTFARDEWLDVLGKKRGEAFQLIKVCEVHFRSKDFCAGKKQLKSHAVPVLKLGSRKNEPLDSDDEFMQCNSDSDPEIIEIKKVSAAAAAADRKQKIKNERSEVKTKIKQEPEIPEMETGRRPSRRAAQVAAKKIYNTVRNYGIGVSADIEDCPPVSVNTPKPPASRTYQRMRQRTFQNVKIPSVNVDLVMECHEELLSAVQAEALLKAQLEYNMVMKTLRSLKASNVRIICSVSDDTPTEKSEPPTIPSSVNENNASCNKPKNITVAPLKPENLNVVPMELTVAFNSPPPIIAT